MENCIFCKIAKGEIPCHKIWEDEKHIAFLTLWPNTEGFSVVITKEHKPSYIFENEDEIINEIVKASKKVAKKIDKAYQDVGRTGLIFEGFGVDHLHSKLIPMHGTGNMKEWKPLQAEVKTYYDTYPGYLATHNSTQRTTEELEEIAKKIRDAE